MDLYWKHYVSALIITAKRASDNGSDVQSSLKSVVNDIATAIKVRLTKSTVRSVSSLFALLFSNGADEVGTRPRVCLAKISVEARIPS